MPARRHRRTSPTSLSTLTLSRADTVLGVKRFTSARRTPSEFAQHGPFGTKSHRPRRRMSDSDCGTFSLGRLWAAGGRSLKPSVEALMAKDKADAVYRIVDVVGVSGTSWEDAGRNAVETAASSLRDLRIAEVTKMDMKVEEGKVVAFRTRVALSFKYEA